MNRHQRRAARVRGPKGETLDVFLLRIIERDKQGRPTLTRICYDEEVLSDVVGDDGRPVFQLVWIPADAVRPS